MKTELNTISKCEVCGNEQLISVLDLGAHPMCDDLVPVGDARICREYPIDILFCEICRTAHQRFQVPKHELFPQTYHYRSRFTADVINGMATLVDSCEEKFGKLSGKQVIDIGCNDGSLLGFFRDKGMITIGIEPTDACLDAELSGHITYNGYLSEELASEIVGSHGNPDFIVFTNVFAHIENLTEVLNSLRRLVTDQTIIVIENHYLGAVLDGNQFDTFYHEHPRTYSYTSFVHIARSLGVSLLGAEFPARYGGNIRVFLGSSNSNSNSCKSVSPEVINHEANILNRFELLRNNIESWCKNKRAYISEHVRRYGKLRAKAFPGRAAILVKLLGLDDEAIFAVYEKPGSMKIGHYLPGTRIPILSDDELFAVSDKSQPILNLAWHIPDEIRNYLIEHGYTGSVIDIISSNDFTDK